MRINNFRLELIVTEKVGIGEINLKKLGNIIALIGKNGSGKTRILQLFEKEYLDKITISNIQSGEILNVPTSVNSIVDEYNRLNNELSELEIFYETQAQYNDLAKKVSRSASNQKIRAEYNSIRVRLKGLKKPTKNKNDILDAMSLYLNKFQKTIGRYIIKIRYSEIRELQNVLNNISPESSPVSFENLVESITESDDYNELGAVYSSGLDYLGKLPNQLLDDFMNVLGDTSKFELKKSYKRFTSLSKYINLFLSKELNWERREIQKSVTSKSVSSEAQGLWTINGRLFDYNELSEGERTLFAYSLLFFLLDQNPNLKVQESIIIVDEPELHLHPQSEFAVINGIKKMISEKGQLWIATHSINILSSLTVDQIFMVKKGEIIGPSRFTPGESFIELMGLEEHIEKLSHFVTNISNWAFLNFMEQCFEDPESFESSPPNDPQIEVFKKVLKDKPNGSILLDFGAGRGRIYRELIKDKSFKLEYFALEPNKKSFEDLKKQGLQNIFVDYADLSKNSFDFILLCNVLHEIPIAEWSKILTKVFESLKDDGYLILIEDTLLPKGEMIGEEGFLILDLESIKHLFSLKNNPAQIISKNRKYLTRILCCTVSKAQFTSIANKNVMESLRVLRNNTLDKIINLRKLEVTDENRLVLGRESSFYSQLYINTILSLAKLENFDKN